MKKFLSCLLAVLMITTLFAVTAGAQVGEGYKDYGDVYIATESGIRLDAEMEDIYLKATPYEIKYLHLGFKNAGTDTETVIPPKTEGRVAGLEQGTVVPDTVATGSAYMVYDGSYLWLYVDIIDSSLNTKAPNALESSFRQDSVEFMMDWTNEAGNNGTQILQARMTHEGYISGREDGPKGVSLFGSVDDGGSNPVTWLKGDAKHTEKGWACEFRIEVPTDFANDKFSLSILINDWDETADGADANKGDRIMVTADDVNGSGQWYGHKYGYIKFDYLNYQPDTGDNTVLYIAVAMVMALGLAAGTVVSMKKRASK